MEPKKCLALVLTSPTKVYRLKYPHEWRRFLVINMWSHYKLARPTHHHDINCALPYLNKMPYLVVVLFCPWNI